MGHEAEVCSVAAFPDGRYVTVGIYGARIWSRDATGVPVGETCEFTRELTYSPDGSEAATLGPDGVLRRWSLEGELLAQEVLPPPTTSGIVGHRGAVAWGEAGLWKLILGPRGFDLWSPAGDRVLAGVPGEPESARRLLYDRNSGWLLVAASEAVLVDPLSGKTIELRDATGASWSCQDAAIHPDGTEVAIGRWLTIHRWELPTGAYLGELEVPAPVDAYLRSLDYDPREPRLVVGVSDYSEESRLVAWNLETGASHERPISAWPRSISFHPHERRLAVGRSDGRIEIVHADSLDTLVSLRGHEGSVPTVRFAPDGRTLLSCGSEGTIRFWRTD